MSLRPGQRISVPEIFHSIPADLTGRLYVIADVSDASGNAAVASSATTLYSQPASVDLIGSFPATLRPVRNGRATLITLTITQAGNVPASGLLGIDLLLSASGALDSNSIDLGTVDRRINVQPGRRTLIQLSKAIPKGLSGNYTVIANLSDPGNVFNDSALSASPVFGPTLSVS